MIFIKIYNCLSLIKYTNILFTMSTIYEIDIESDILESDIDSDILESDIESDILESDIESDILESDKTIYKRRSTRKRRCQEVKESITHEYKSITKSKSKSKKKEIVEKEKPIINLNYRAKYAVPLLLKQCSKCNLCKKQLEEDFIIDHIVQKKYIHIYGDHVNDIFNLQALCSLCNRIKTYKVDKEIDKIIDSTKSFDTLHKYIMDLLQDYYEKKKCEKQYMMSKNDFEDECEPTIRKRKYDSLIQDSHFQNCTFQNCTFSK
jgi:5-methylcytosine-specific restriction endonuclease McrA